MTTGKIETAIILILMFVLPKTAFGQSPDIRFFQGDTITLKKGKKSYYEMDLVAEPFTIIFGGNELHVCAGLDEKLFDFTKPNTDINADANSYFFIFKYLAGSADSDFLSIEEDTSTSLNETHGARPASGGNYQYTVRNIMNDGDMLKINEFKRLFLALWLDVNKDQFVDKEELLRVRVNIKKK